jgi:ATP-binding cassette subfamily B protein
MINDTVDSGDRLTLFSDMIVFSSYALQAMGAFVFMLLAVIMLPRFLVSLKRVNEIINAKNSIEDGKFESGANGMVGSIEFRNVSFAYPGASGNAISDISFKVERGMTLAIIGSTGSGKTTLMNLIPRLYDATEGVILVDGRDVRDYKIWALRDKIGYVPQKSFLFAGTIASNIDYGQKSGLQATLNEIKKAAEVGQSKEFIENKEGNYQAKVEEGGTNFSGGQRQRLTISRAICRDPEIYLFDDSFSALDFQTDKKLRQALKETASGATVSIVAQRIGTIRSADQIIVMDEGVIVGIGKHEELLKTCRVYQEIAKSQLSEKEVAELEALA